MKERTRVLVQSPLPPPSGGVSTWTANLLASDLAERFDIQVVNTALGRLDRGPAQLLLRRAAVAARTFAHIAAALHTFRPHVLHVCCNGFASALSRDAAGLGLAGRAGVRTVVHLHGDAARLHLRPALSQRVLSRVDALVTLGEGSRRSAEALGLGPVHVVPNSIALRLPPVREPIAGRPVRLLYVGWLIPAKGLMELLDAVATSPNVTLTVVGRWVADSRGNTLEPAVRARLSDPSLAERVHLVGEVPLAEVWDFYARADAFVLPSWTEGFPMTLLEAMISGLPCVVTPVGAMGEAVTDGHNGLVVPVRDAAALATALRSLTPERVARMGEAAYQRATERYTHDVAHAGLAHLWDVLAR